MDNYKLISTYNNNIFGTNLSPYNKYSTSTLKAMKKKLAERGVFI